ncbi:MAG: hypothetical protein PHW60_11670 [Kiritimatiellae bacterium]|nr:hypothetical protein [Kiritimatiellia bacterium]
MQIMRQSLFVLWLGLMYLAVTVRAQTNAVPLAAAAHAQTNAAPTDFQSADTNADGRVSQAEFDEHVKKSNFENLDANNDGVITLAEWKAVDHSAAAARNFAAMDKNHNGRINYPEFSDMADKNSNLNNSFKSLDRDMDSKLAPDELTRHPMFRLLSVDF